jgi:hypothetical protein
METWKLMGWTAVLLVIWAVIVSALGYDLGPGTILVAAVFSMVGFWVASKVFGEYLPAPDEEG